MVGRGARRRRWVRGQGGRVSVRQEDRNVEVIVDDRVVYRSRDGAGPPQRDVNLAGMEFGAEQPSFCNARPGTPGVDYFYPVERTIVYFARLGIRRFRLPLRWERIQRQLGHPLDPPELQRLQSLLNLLDRHGCRAVLDLHNYGRYRLQIGGAVGECPIETPLPGESAPRVRAAHFADLWRRLALALGKHPAVEAYGLMNEPHGLQGAWRSVSQAAVDAIRAAGDGLPVLVAGDQWSHACDWPQVNGALPWIADPADNALYEAHCYFDADHTGTYRLTFDQERQANPDVATRGRLRVIPFARWCAANGVRGWIGEYGAPAADARWLTLLADFLEELDEWGLSSAYWAAGEHWGDYPLSIQPPADEESSIAPQLAVLLRRPMTAR